MKGIRTYRKEKGKNILVAWIQPRCINCGRFLGLHHEKQKTYEESPRGRELHRISQRTYAKNHPEKRRQFQRNYLLRKRMRETLVILNL
jgi:hypothetical protein